MSATIQKLIACIRRRLQSAQRIELGFNEYCKVSDLTAESELSFRLFYYHKSKLPGV